MLVVNALRWFVSNACTQLSDYCVQDSCARVLLFRGADRTVLNLAGQNACHAAIVAGNPQIAELIKNYSSSDVG